MRTLDERLYDWLLEADERRFELLFEAYFRQAFPATIKYLARMSRWERADLEELAQLALIRFFNRIGVERRQAGERVRLTMQTLMPPGHDPGHDLGVIRWQEAVLRFRGRAFGFHPARFASIESEWRAEIGAVQALIEPLQLEGLMLIHALGPNRDRTSTDASLDFEALLLVCARFVEEQCTTEAPPDLRSFLLNASGIVPLLTRLQIPTNGYLFDTALSVYFDERRRRLRRKRSAPEVCEVQCAETREASEASEDLKAFEDIEELERFYEYLRQPVEELADLYEAALQRGSGKSERHRLQAADDKLERALSVLALLGEGHGQEDIAERLGITRNQVKYVIQLVHEEFLAFRGRRDAPARERAQVS